MDTTVQVYAKSWVFEGTGEEAYRQPGDSSSVSICSSNSPTRANVSTSKTQNHKKGHSSKLSDATSERFNPQMSSFSRCATPSPIPNSGQATPTNAIYADFLSPSHNHRGLKTNRLTVDYVTTVDPTIAPGVTVVTPTIVATSSVAPPKYVTKANIQTSNGPSSISSQQDDSQYASMLAELEQSLIEKKIQATTSMSPDDTSLTASTDKFGSSKSSSKDLEFSKELEAALQLIQDLETPSEGPADGTSHPITAKVARSESEKTLSAAVSLPSPEQGPVNMQTPDEAQTPQNGKHDAHDAHDEYRRTNVIIHVEPNSQSTSGYSSPNSYSSNVRLSHASSGISSSTIQDSVYTGDNSNVVRIYIEQNSPCSTPSPNSMLSTKSQSNLNLNSYSNSNLNLFTKDHIANHSHIEAIENEKQSNEKSYILFKKRTKLLPHTDFQNRIFKSECLAYLTDEELVARHKCNRDVIRVRATLLHTLPMPRFASNYFNHLLTEPFPITLESFG